MSQICLLNTMTTNVMSAMTMMVVLILMLQLHEAKAATYIVGDQRGWTIPPYDNYYNTWASKHRVKVNDILVFKFEYGKQNWAWVERHDYNVCNTTAVPVVASKYTIGLRVLTPTTFHFMCTFPGHCSRGQKMSLTVVCA